jgi:hypothetical protein
MRTILAVGLVAAAAIVAVSAPAQASCFYNQSSVNTVNVDLSCGVFCSAQWGVKKGDYNCKGGSGGTFRIYAPGQGAFLLKGVVDDRGYVTIHGSCETGITVKSWTANHGLRMETKTDGSGQPCN